MRSIEENKIDFILNLGFLFEIVAEINITRKKSTILAFSPVMKLENIQTKIEKKEKQENKNFGRALLIRNKEAEEINSRSFMKTLYQ